MPESRDILIASEPIAPAEVRRLVQLHFGDMVKFVVDLEHGRVALGGELHADAEALLIEAGSSQENPWGGNYHPGRGEAGCVEYSSMINLRPSQQNRSMLVEDAGIRERIRALVFALVGRGEPLA